MRNTTKIIIALFLIFISCNKKKEINIIINPKIQLEKIIVINLNEVCITYFKVQVNNGNQKIVVFLDNSLKEYQLKKLKPEKKGFYLKNIPTDSIITLGIDNYSFYEVGAEKSGSFFIGAINVENSFKQKDSLVFKKSISSYVLEYNGKKLDFNKIEKTNYINKNSYDDFIKRKRNLIPFTDSLSIIIPKNIKVNYYNRLPSSQEEWDKL